MLRAILRRWVSFTMLHIVVAALCALVLTTQSVQDLAARKGVPRINEYAGKTMNVLFEPLQRLGAYREATEPTLYFLYMLNSGIWGVGLAILWTLIRRVFQRKASPPAPAKA